MYFRSTLSFILILLFTNAVQAQDPARFQGEVDQIDAKEFQIDQERETVVFTGSSSIRKWTNVNEAFPTVNAINTGFGGSQFSDLIYYSEELIFKYNPDKIFIYEGDNDIEAGKTPSQVLAGAAYLFAQIRRKYPSVAVYFISPKPSPSRWDLRSEYEQTNHMLKDFCEFDDSITYVDVWEPMIGDDGKPRPDIFVEDNLHMNAKGYQIWKTVMASYISSN